jgi:hypothetical protein
MYWTSFICDSHVPWDFANIEPYMISVNDIRAKKTESITVSVAIAVEAVTTVVSVEPVTTVEPVEVFAPLRKQSVRKCQDPLFWTLFLAKYGETEYKRASKNPNTEMREKKIIAEHFHGLGSGKTVSDLSIKMSKTGCNRTVEDIMTQPKLLLSSLPAFCHYYQINIYIVDNKKKTYLQFLLDNHEKYDNVILYRKPDRKYTEYFVDMPIEEEDNTTIADLKKNFLCLISFEKSLKSVSFYKLNELIQLYALLGMTDPPKKKHELYEKIAVHCVWEIGK